MASEVNERTILIWLVSVLCALINQSAAKHLAPPRKRAAMVHHGEESRWDTAYAPMNTVQKNTNFI